MNVAKAESAVTTSALVVGGIFLYRHLVEPSIGNGREKGKASNILMGGAPPSVPTFVVGWGFTFLTLSMVAAASPELGGWFAILVALGAILTNGQTVLSDVSKRTGQTNNSKGNGKNG